jgi:hypothetical protein
MNVDIGNVAAQFLFWELLLQIFDNVSLQCIRTRKAAASIYFVIAPLTKYTHDSASSLYKYSSPMPLR